MNHLSQSLGAVDARKVEHEEQRSGVVGALHEAKSFLVAQLFDQSPCQPCGEALGKRSGLNAGFHITEGELLFHLDGTVKREVRKPLCLRGKRANDLDALIDRHMVGLLQVEDLAERHAERIAHIGLDILGIGQNGIDELVERALAGNDFRNQHARKRTLLHRLVGVGDELVDALAQVAALLADVGEHLMSQKTRRRCLGERTLLLALARTIAEALGAA